MSIIARNLEGLSAVAVSGAPLALPEPAAVLAELRVEEARGMRFVDDSALHVRVFTLPALGLQLVFEPTRVRLDAMEAKKPNELQIGKRLGALLSSLYPSASFVRYGFNYDIAYQYDSVIPQREILEAFLTQDALEDVTHFGWQCTRLKEKGKRRETYFFKVVSPLELRVLANIEFEGQPPKDPARLQEEYERCHLEAQTIVRDLTFA